MLAIQSPYDFSKVTIDRHIMTKEELGNEEYKRYKPVENGISPRIMPVKLKIQL